MKSKQVIKHFLRIAALALIFLWAYLLMKPFLLIIVWSIIIAVAIYPLYQSFISKIGSDRRKLGTFLFALIAIIIAFIPAYFVVGNLYESISSIAVQIKTGTLQIPAPQESVKSWPIIGEKVFDQWNSFSLDLKSYFVEHKDQVMKYGGIILSDVEGFIVTVLIFIVSFFVAIILMYFGESGYKASLSLFKPLVGKEGAEEVVLMSRDTIRSVNKGVLLVGVIQAILALIGFEAIGLPGAGIFTLLVLVVSIIQMPVWLVLIPTVIISFSHSDTTYAVIFAVYCVFVSFSNDFLKSVLLGKGLKTPLMVIFLGTLGGVALHGLIGLFVGPVVMAVTYRLYEYWVISEE